MTLSHRRGHLRNGWRIGATLLLSGAAWAADLGAFLEDARSASPAANLAAAEAWRIVPVTELEYRLWCIRHPDDDHRHHVNHWNWIKTRVPAQRHAEFARHPLGPGEAYWLHRVGTAGAGAADRRDCHLWRWNGRHAALLQAFVREGGVSHFAPPAGPDEEA